MRSSKAGSVRNIFSTVDEALAASDISEFMRGLKVAYGSLHEVLLQSSPGSLGSYEAALSSAAASPRSKQVLQAAAWPIFDKPGLPAEDRNLPEFLWLFAVPFLVKFKEEQLSTPVALGSVRLDDRVLTNMSNTTHRFNEKAVLTYFPTLFTREDLQKIGPVSLSTSAVQVELGLATHEVLGGDIFFDEHIESARATILYCVGIARLPIGERGLFEQSIWPAQPFEEIIGSALSDAKLQVEKIQGFEPCSMVEALFKCSLAGYCEIKEVLLAAQLEYGVSSVTLELPTSGWAEIHGTQQGAEDEPLLLAPAFSFMEPTSELEKCVLSCCRELGLEFKGSFSVAGPTSSMLQ